MQKIKLHLSFGLNSGLRPNYVKKLITFGNCLCSAALAVWFIELHIIPVLSTIVRISQETGCEDRQQNNLNYYQGG